MKHITSTLLVLILASLACSFGTPNQTQGSGTIVKKTYTVQGFDQVQLDTIGEVHIEQGGTESLIIETDDNILPLLEVRVEDGKLILREEGNGHNFKPSSKLIYTVTVKDLTSVATNTSGDISVGDIKTAGSFSAASNGSGNVTVKSVEADAAYVNTNGSGDIVIAGKINTETVSINGSGDVSAGELHASKGTVTIQGSGKATVWIDNELQITINGSGNVSYYGKPSLTQNSNGSGQIKNLGEK